MGNQTSQPDESSKKENASDSRTPEDKKLDRLADKAAERAERTEQRYDSEHDIFTK